MSNNTLYIEHDRHDLHLNGSRLGELVALNVNHELLWHAERLELFEPLERVWRVAAVNVDIVYVAQVIYLKIKRSKFNFQVFGSSYSGNKVGKSRARLIKDMVMFRVRVWVKKAYVG